MPSLFNSLRPRKWSTFCRLQIKCTVLSHWHIEARMMHIFYTASGQHIGWGNGLSPDYCQTITWTSDNLLPNWPRGMNLRGIWYEIAKTVLSRKCRISSPKCYTLYSEPLFHRKTPSYGYRNPIINLRRSDERLRFILGISLSIRRCLFSE